jgi:hypothetical protein
MNGLRGGEPFIDKKDVKRVQTAGQSRLFREQLRVIVGNKPERAHIARCTKQCHQSFQRTRQLAGAD